MTTQRVSAPLVVTRDGSTLRFDRDTAPVVVTVCGTRIFRVKLQDSGRPGPSHVLPRDWLDRLIQRRASG